MIVKYRQTLPQVTDEIGARSVSMVTAESENDGKATVRDRHYGGGT